MFFLTKNDNAQEIEIAKKRQRVVDKKFYEEQIIKMSKDHLNSINGLKKFYEQKFRELQNEKIQKYEDKIAIREKGIERLRQEIRSLNKRLRKYERAYFSTNALRDHLIETNIKFEQSIANIKSYSSRIIQEFNTVHDMVEFHERQAGKVQEKLEDIYLK